MKNKVCPYCLAPVKILCNTCVEQLDHRFADEFLLEDVENTDVVVREVLGRNYESSETRFN